MDRELIPDDEPGGSVIPPGQMDLAMFLSTLPQVSPYDCGVELDVLTMSGINHIAHETSKTVDEVARDMAYHYFRLYFVKPKAEEEQA